MKLGDLTTLADVKGWLATTNYVSSGTGVDYVLTRLISSWSQAILAELERPWILPKKYLNEAYDGKGGNRQFLRNWPVTSVQSVSINGQSIPYTPWVPNTNQPQQSASSTGFGYTIEFDAGDPPGSPQSIELMGGCFYHGNQNVQISYTAGYQVTDEPQIIPVPNSSETNPQVTLIQPLGIWGQDISVTYSDGTLLTPTSSAPTTAGTYQVLQPDTPISGGLQPPGVYVFNAADADRDVLITYGYIPGALEQIAIELVCERFAYRGRIGEVSRTLGNQVTAKYDLSEFPAYVRPVLQRYRSILPL